MYARIHTYVTITYVQHSIIIRIIWNRFSTRNLLGNSFYNDVTTSVNIIGYKQ